MNSFAKIRAGFGIYQKYLLMAMLVTRTIVSPAQVDSGSFFLHKFAQNIGRETYRVTRVGNELKYDINFKFVDRGSPVPLKAQLRTTIAYEPLSLIINGNTSRFSSIDDSIVVQDKNVALRIGDSVYQQALRPLSFPVGGYSPGTVQMILLKYWKKHREPKSITLLPAGAVTIRQDGRDTLRFNNQSLALNRYILSGLVWGNEIIWTDSKDELVCLITNDAEGDKLEMMQEKYEPLLPELISRAAIYGMKLFAASMKIQPSEQQLVAVVGGNLVDVEDGQTITNSVIIIGNGLIKQIGKKDEVTIPANATIIHAEGKTILPGLWDMHAHFQQAEWGPAYLAAGVTTVRDCGNEFGYITAIKKAIDGGEGVGPNILKAGIIDGPGEMGLGIVRATTKEEAVKAVDMYKDNGFVQIKIYSSLKPEIVKAIADEAHRIGLTVTGHIPEGMTLQQGIDSGMDQVNHIQYVTAAMKKNSANLIDLEDSSNRAVILFLKDHKVVIDPTIGVYEIVLRSVKEDISTIEPAFQTLPVPLQNLFINMGMPEEQALKYKPRLQEMIKLVKVLYDNDITIVAGTDMGFPGYSLHRELELYVAAGLTPLQAIRAATIVPAGVMKIDAQTGSLKPGKKADLVIIDGDPLARISDIRKVWKVIKNGQEYDPKLLHRIAGFKE